MTLQERVQRRIVMASSDECWLWLGNTDKDGYAQHTVRFPASGRRRNFRIGRLVLEWKLGRSLYPGMQACHSCDQPACCNPRHLFEGTNQQNVDDKLSKGRQPRGAAIKTPIQQIKAARPEIQVRGETHPRARLTELQVREVLQLRREGWSQWKLAARFGVSRRSIRSILDGRNWRHLNLEPTRKEVGKES